MIVPVGIGCEEQEDNGNVAYTDIVLRLSFATCGLILLGAAPALSQTPAPKPAPAPPATPAPNAPQTPAPVAPAVVETPDYPSAIWAPAAPNNFQPSDRPSADQPIDRIVIHDIEGSAISAVRWFQNPKAGVSSHYVVDADGKVYQQVKERNVGWHAGDRITNTRSVGIEHDGYAYRPGFFNSVEYEASAKLTRNIALRYSIPRDREHIIGHFEVPDSANPGKFGGRSGHTDPGPYWDWDTFMMLVRNDAQVQGELLPLVLHPGEKGTATVSVVNTGDDIWPADLKYGPYPEVRAQGPVYLGTTRESNIPGSESLLHNDSWVSPRFTVTPGNGDVAAGAAGQFVVPITAPATVHAPITEAFRLFKVPVAPRQPVAFGPTVTLTVRVDPWDVGAALPTDAPQGWSRKETPDGMRTFWRKSAVSPKEAPPAPVRWQPVLPIKGQWDVYIRYTPGKGRSPRARYQVQTADKGIQTVAVNQNTQGNQWVKLGRFRFEAAPTTGPGVRPGDTVPAAPPVLGAVTLLPGSDKAGIIVAGDVRFVGPFPDAPKPTGNTIAE